MDQKELLELVKSGVRVSELAEKSGAGFHERVVPQLYQWWRENRLAVMRYWGGTREAPETVVYTNSACLLPDDCVHLVAQQAVANLQISTWNVNSIRSRLPLVLSWLAEQQPDIVCLQETKVEDHQFPEQELRAAGYTAVFIGQKSYNGVAILSKYPITHVQYGFEDGYDAENKRLLMARVEGINIVNVYVPQGQSVDSPKFTYKLEFLEKLAAELARHFSASDPVIMLGDINIAPDERDVVSAEAMQNQVSFHPKEHVFIERFKQWGLEDLYRKFHQESGRYSWWDFRTRGFEKNDGMRIDHIWVTKSVADRSERCEIDLNNRSQPKPSDHAPVICTVKTVTTSEDV